MKTAIIGILALGFVSVGAAQAQVTTLEFQSSSVIGTDYQLQTGGTSLTAVPITGSIMATMVFYGPISNLTLVSYNINLTGSDGVSAGLGNSYNADSGYPNGEKPFNGAGTTTFGINGEGLITANVAEGNITSATLNLNTSNLKGGGTNASANPSSASVEFNLNLGSLGGCENLIPGFGYAPVSPYTGKTITGCHGGAGGPGTWTVTKAPEIDPATAASGLTLLLGGMAVLRGRKRARD
jgi:hypothetical protein